MQRGANPTTCQEYRGDELVLQDNQEYRVAEGDVEDIHEWRQPKAVDRCWVCVGVCGQRSSITTTTEIKEEEDYHWVAVRTTTYR